MRDTTQRVLCPKLHNRGSNPPSSKRRTLPGAKVISSARHANRLILFPMNVADQVRRLLKSADCPTRTVALETGINPGTLSGFISGKRELPTKQLELIVGCLGYRIIVVHDKASRKHEIST